MENSIPEYQIVEGGLAEVQKRINALAQEGWQVVSMSAGGPNGYVLFVMLQKNDREHQSESLKIGGLPDDGNTTTVVDAKPE